MREVKISMENEKIDKLIKIVKDEVNCFHCTVTLPYGELIKFEACGWELLLNKLGHLLIAMTPRIERGRYVAEV